MDIKKGYYLVKHYNYERIKIMFFNGTNFEGFKSDPFTHDEIEWYRIINTKTVQATTNQQKAIEILKNAITELNENLKDQLGENISNDLEEVIALVSGGGE